MNRTACIINERRAAGRKGLGAVMGAKNLKAVAVKGSLTVPVADKVLFIEIKQRFLKASKLVMRSFLILQITEHH